MTLKLTIELTDDAGRCKGSFELSVREVIETTGEELPPDDPPSLPAPRTGVHAGLRLVAEAA